MPFQQINLEDIIFDPDVQKLCISENFKCPNYNHSWACPPEAPYMKGEVSKYSKFFLVYIKFDLASYVKKQKQKYPYRSEQSIRNRFYMKNILRDDLEKKIDSFLEKYNNDFEEKLIFWDGHCRLCEKRDYQKCTYDDGDPCRFPNQIRYSMESVGIDVTKMVNNLDLDIEWPPVNYLYRFGLICLK